MKFKCKTTNLIYSFEYEVDIAAMMKHPDYETVGESEEVQTEESKPVKTTKKQAKVTPDETNIDGA
jgi:hypothetical protein